ncbi:helix-turn-helix domain-containing protein [Flagellimonas flava]|uniref:helix-turn-helix domain-containing protein n=1 Tax=Flagellimonas TaxID=444459 RepID=UPI003D660DAA
MEFRTNIPTELVKPHFSTDPWNIQGWVVVELLSLHLFIYGCVSIVQIIKYRRNDKKVEREKINWLTYVTGILILGSLILFFSQGGKIEGYVFFKSPFPHYSADLFSVFAMYLITLYLLGKTDLFKFPSKKYSKSSLSSFYKREKLNQITTLIETEKLYLNEDFSLKMLSEKSGLSTHNISQILNEELQVGFITLTNSYRIEEAKRRLLGDEFNLKMEQLAYDLGYKSKSTFFSAFKKETNSTPSNYRKKSIQ